MKKLSSEISLAMLRLTHIGPLQHAYDEHGVMPGAGPIHYLVEVAGRLCMAWESEESRMIVVAPISCWQLDDMMELMQGDPWTVLAIPAHSGERVAYGEMSDAEVIAAYQRMEERAIAAPTLPVMAHC